MAFSMLCILSGVSSLGTGKKCTCFLEMISSMKVRRTEPVAKYSFTWMISAIYPITSYSEYTAESTLEITRQLD
jgi:hypothetical protein